MVETSASPEVLQTLKAAIDRGSIEILLSPTVIEETFPTIALSKRNLNKEFQLIFDLVLKGRIIKTPQVLLAEAVQSYALGHKLPDMLTKIHRKVVRALKEGRDSEKIAEKFITLARNDKENFSSVFANVRRFGEAYNVDAPMNFQELWKKSSLERAGSLAASFNLYESCKKLGFEGLLEAKAVKLHTLYCLSWIYSKWFGEQGVPGKIGTGDFGDLLHSVQATAADVFVTNEKRLPLWLKRVPVDGFDVINLNELIDRIT